MNNHGFQPSGDPALVIWTNNFDTNLGSVAAAAGITPDEVTGMHKDALYFQYVVNMQESFTQYMHTIVQYKNLVKHAVAQQSLGALPAVPVLGTAPEAVAEGIFDRVGKLIKRIKASANYNDNMGQLLGIVAPVTVIDTALLQPVLKVKIDAGRPRIKTVKGNAEALDLYVDRKDGAGYVFLCRLIKFNYIDIASLPANTLFAEWDYKGMYVIGNNPVGLMSAVVSIIVKKL